MAAISTWTALSGGLNGWPQALALSGPDVLVGGGFTEAGSHPAIGFSIWHTGVLRVPRITAFDVIGLDALIHFTTMPWQTYAIEHKQSMGAGPWTLLTESIAGDGTTNLVTHPGGAILPTQFYRVATELSPLAKP